jgi:glycosyltransferase involved in cell wall biosynthesis
VFFPYLANYRVEKNNLRFYKNRIQKKTGSGIFAPCFSHFCGAIGYNNRRIELGEVGMGQLKLSILIMTPGKRPYVEKCLKSLTELRKKIPSELIITDTGCDDTARNLIEQYADQIVKFDWCDDFAAARNKGLELAKGEWILYLDDDEPIVDPAPWIDFLQSDDSNQYDVVSFMQRHYKDWTEEEYLEQVAQRLYRRLDGMHFEGKIHERLVNRGTNKIFLPAVIGHYGYIFETPTDLMRHANRNIRPLQQRLEEHPEDLHAVIQLLQEFRVIAEYSQMKLYASKYLEAIENDSKEQRKKYIGILIGALLESGFNCCIYEDVLSGVSKYLHHEECDEVDRTMMYCYGTQAAYKLEDYEQALDYGLCYIQGYLKYRDSLERFGRFFVEDSFNNRSAWLAVFSMIIAAMHIKRYEFVSAACEILPWEDKKFRLHEDYMETLCNAVEDNAPVDVMQDLLKKVLFVPNFRDYFFALVQNRMLMNPKYTSYLYVYIRDIDDVSNNYFYTLKILGMDTTKDGECLPELYHNLFQGVNDVLNLSDSIYEIAAKNKIDLKKEFKEIPMQKFVNGLEYMMQSTGINRFEKAQTIMNRYVSMDDEKYRFFKFAILYKRLLETTDMEFIDRIELMEKMIPLGHEYYDQIYKKHAYEERCFLPEPLQVMIALEEILQAIGTGDYRTAFMRLKNAIRENPNQEKVLTDLSHQYAQFLQATM